MIEGWWFARMDEDRRVRLPRGDGRLVVVGETLTVPGPVVLCQRGLHASRRAFDALQYAPGPVLCRVRLSGVIVEGDDKIVGTERTTLAMLDVTGPLRVAAAACAYTALTMERAAGREPDPRSWAAVEVAQRYSAGCATEAELAAARSAAGAAARYAAGDAARDAAWDAAGDAAWYAARSAAGAAAGAAARDAACDAAGDAAWDAAWDAAGDAARGSFAESFEKLMRDAFGLDRVAEATRR